MTSFRHRSIGQHVRHAALTGTATDVTIDHKRYRVTAVPIESERDMSELTERVHGEILAVYTDGYDREVSDIYAHAHRIIALVREADARLAGDIYDQGYTDGAASERQRIREALLDGDGDDELMHEFLNAFDEGSFNDGLIAMLSHIGIEPEEDSDER